MSSTDIILVITDIILASQARYVINTRIQEARF